MRETYDIFKCKHQSLYRWVKKYEEDGELQRKVRDSKPLKITNEIKAFIKEEIIKLNTITLMDLATAIAIEILGNYESVIDTHSPLEFIHMKPMIQKWESDYVSWINAVPYIFNNKSETNIIHRYIISIR